MCIYDLLQMFNGRRNTVNEYLIMNDYYRDIFNEPHKDIIDDLLKYQKIIENKMHPIVLAVESYRRQYEYAFDFPEFKKEIYSPSVKIFNLSESNYYYRTSTFKPYFMRTNIDLWKEQEQDLVINL